MNWRPDPQDFMIFDLREQVTLQRVQPDGTVLASYGGINALPEPTIAANVGDVGGTQMTAETVTWHLKASDLPPGIRIDRGDRIVSVSDTYSGTWVARDADNVVDRLQAVVRTQRLLDP